MEILKSGSLKKVKTQMLLGYNSMKMNPFWEDNSATFDAYPTITPQAEEQFTRNQTYDWNYDSTTNNVQYQPNNINTRTLSHYPGKIQKVQTPVWNTPEKYGSPYTRPFLSHYPTVQNSRLDVNVNCHFKTNDNRFQSRLRYPFSDENKTLSELPSCLHPTTIPDLITSKCLNLPSETSSSNQEDKFNLTEDLNSSPDIIQYKQCEKMVEKEELKNNDEDKKVAGDGKLYLTKI